MNAQAMEEQPKLISELVGVSRGGEEDGEEGEEPGEDESVVAKVPVDDGSDEDGRPGRRRHDSDSD